MRKGRLFSLPLRPRLHLIVLGKLLLTAIRLKVFHTSLKTLPKKKAVDPSPTASCASPGYKLSRQLTD